MKIIPLPFETQARLGFNTKIILDSTDLSGTGVLSQFNALVFSAAWTSGTAQAVLPFNKLGASSITFPAGYQMQPGAVANVVTAFTSSGGAITTLTLSLGDGSSATRYLNAVDLKTAGYSGSALTAPYTYTAADTVDAVATIAGQTMASLNAGVVEILCNLRPVPDLADVK